MKPFKTPGLGTAPVQQPFGGEINPGKPMNPNFAGGWGKPRNPNWGGAQIDSGTGGGGIAGPPVQKPLGTPLVQNPFGGGFGKPVNPAWGGGTLGPSIKPPPPMVAPPVSRPRPQVAAAPAAPAAPAVDPEAPGPGLDMGNGAQSVGLRRGGMVKKHGSPKVSAPCRDSKTIKCY